jgi:hypothetical protein
MRRGSLRSKHNEQGSTYETYRLDNQELIYRDLLDITEISDDGVDYVVAER